MSAQLFHQLRVSIGKRWQVKYKNPTHKISGDETTVGLNNYSFTLQKITTANLLNSTFAFSVNQTNFSAGNLLQVCVWTEDTMIQHSASYCRHDAACC